MFSLLNGIGHVIWLTALAAVLAGISIAHYQSRITELTLWDLLTTKSNQNLGAASGIGFSVGMGFTADHWAWVGFWILVIGLLCTWMYTLEANPGLN
jgi:hypothetical protein